MSGVLVAPVDYLSGATLNVNTLNASNAISATGAIAAVMASASAKIGNVGPAFAAGLLAGTTFDLNLYRVGADAWGTDDSIRLNDTTGKSFLDMREQAGAPANPAADTGRLYVEDNGAGKSRLVVKFPTGAAIVIATEV